MNEIWAAIGISLSLAISVAALAYALWDGRHGTVELAQPNAEDMRIRDEQQAAIDGLLSQQQRLTLRVLELEREMSDLRLELSEWKQGGVLNIAFIEAKGLEPPWKPRDMRQAGVAPKGAPNSTPDNETVTLYQQIANQFSLDEMSELAMNAGIPEGEFGGDTKTARARELVQFALRHDKLTDLVDAARKARPRSRWGRA